MEQIAKLISLLPEWSHGLVAVLALILYVALPSIRNYKEERDYWKFRNKQVGLLERYAKLISENNHDQNDNTARIINEIQLLRPPELPATPNPMPLVPRIAIGYAGAMTALLIISMTHYFLGSFDIKTALGGAFVQSLLPGFLTVFAPSPKKSRVFLFGLGIGGLSHVIFTVAYVLATHGT